MKKRLATFDLITLIWNYLIIAKFTQKLLNHRDTRDKQAYENNDSDPNSFFIRIFLGMKEKKI